MPHRRPLPVVCGAAPARLASTAHHDAGDPPRHGFGYPSAPLPTGLNIASKILAFITALTLFLPQRPAPGQEPQPDNREQAQPASPALPLDSPARLSR